MEPIDLFSTLRDIEARLTRLENIVCPESEPPRGASLEEVRLFCSKCGLTENDAQWFYAKMESSGWRNNGKPVRKWTMCITAWRLANIFPSQKQTNGSVYTAKTVLESKKSIATQLKNKYSYEMALGTSWNDQQKRTEYQQIVREIKELESQLSQML